MKSLISVSHFFLFFLMLESYFIPSAKAQCVQGDVSVQYSISGSQERTQRTNDVTMKSDSNCRGNSSITTGVQGHIGPNATEQNRRVNNIQEGNNKYPQMPTEERCKFVLMYKLMWIIPLIDFLIIPTNKDSF